MTRFLRTLRTTVVSLALLSCVALGLVMLGPAIAGYDRYVLVSGSMTGSYDQGSIVYTKTVPVGELRVGDVITYAPPAGESPTKLVTHRIASVRPGPDGPVFRTKGDANRTIDPWQFSLSRPQQPKVEFSVPYAGHAISALAIRKVRMLAIGLPAALVALIVMGRLAADVRRHRRGERGAAAVGA